MDSAVKVVCRKSCQKNAPFLSGRRGVGWTIGCQDDAFVRRLGAYDLQRSEGDTFGKKAEPFSQNQRMDQENVLVYQIAIHQRAYQLSAAHRY